jgi:hypothetical protein
MDELVINCKYNKSSLKSQNSWAFFEQIREWYLSGHDNLNGDTVMNYINH